MNESEKYVSIADVKRKLRYLFKTYGASDHMKDRYISAIERLPYVLKAELETTLEVKEGKE